MVSGITTETVQQLEKTRVQDPVKASEAVRKVLESLTVESFTEAEQEEQQNILRVLRMYAVALTSAITSPSVHMR